MAMKKKVVIEGSTVTVGQCKDLFRMIGDGTIGFTEMERFLGSSSSPLVWVSAEQLELLFMSIREKTIDFAEIKYFLEYPKGNTPLRYPSYVRAINILGHDKVITVQQAYRLWNMSYSLEERHTLDQIRYSESTLRKCAIENKKNKTSWHLIYIIGKTLPEQRAILGNSPESQPCFRPGYDWFLDEKEKFWADKKPTNGEYYLINFHDFGTHGLNYSEQLEKVGELGPGYGVVNPHILAESLISLRKNTNESVACLWTHRSSVVNAKGDYVCVGDFSYGTQNYFGTGLKVESEPFYRKYGSCRIAVYKKHDEE
ncbi:MAG: hypothetical protein WCL02_08645 [bacterium]